jgi:tagatose-6-phosphate ketose/aldose isomerase
MISFARSGNSPESTATLNIANSLCPEIYHLVITCNPSGNITRLVRPDKDFLIVLPERSHDEGLAMTGSFTSMTLAAYLISKLEAIGDCKSRVALMADSGNKILHEYRDTLYRISQLNFTRVVFLGSGPMLGSAHESHLKLQELTGGNIICKYDSYLGFRHGPKAVVDKNTVLFFLISNKSYVQQYEFDLIHEIHHGEQGLHRVAIAEQKPPVQGFDDIMLIGKGDGKKLDETMLAIVNVLPAQIAGFFKSIMLGLKPDSPSESGAISRVVQGVNIYDYKEDL